MLYKFIIADCECWLTQRTIAEIEAERRQAEAEAAEWEAVMQARKAWELTGDPRDWDYYSDLHKDAYGFRPHY